MCSMLCWGFIEFASTPFSLQKPLGCLRYRIACQGHINDPGNCPHHSPHGTFSLPIMVIFGRNLWHLDLLSWGKHDISVLGPWNSSDHMTPTQTFIHLSVKSLKLFFGIKFDPNPTKWVPKWPLGNITRQDFVAGFLEGNALSFFLFCGINLLYSIT